MTTAKSATTTQSTVELSPSYKIPVTLIIVALPLLVIQIWLGGAILLFGLFLLFQTKTIRLQFTNTALDVYRSGQQIRQFPYTDWQNWQIFWSAVPILFYFKEVKSIHFLPIIFDPEQLKTCLNQHCPRQE